MKKYQKTLTIIILSLLLFTSFNIKSVKALTFQEQLEELQRQLDIILQKIKDLIAQLESQKGGEQKSISLISPNGMEIWESGSTYDIKWNSSGYSSNAKVQIILIDERKEPNSLGYEIKIIEADNNGLYKWTVPESLEGKEVVGSLYKIAVSLGQGNDKKSDTSDGYFTVRKKLSPYLNVIYPNGGEILETGKIFRIKWDSPGFENQQADIILKRGSITQMIVADDIANLNFYDWLIPDNLPGNNTYKIIIELHDTQGTIATSDYSDTNFTIVKTY